MFVSFETTSIIQQTVFQRQGGTSHFKPLIFLSTVGLELGIERNEDKEIFTILIIDTTELLLGRCQIFFQQMLHCLSEVV